MTKCLNDLFKVRKILVNRNIIDVENVGKAKAGSPSTDASSRCTRKTGQETKETTKRIKLKV